MDPFTGISARLRASIASKAGVTLSEVEQFLNLRQNINRDIDNKLQHPKTPYSPAEEKFILENQSIAKDLNPIQMMPVPVNPTRQKRTPAKRKQSEASENLDKLIIKMAKKRSTTKDIVIAAKKKFPNLDIDDCVIRSRKSRLRKSGKLI